MLHFIQILHIWAESESLCPAQARLLFPLDPLAPESGFATA